MNMMRWKLITLMVFIAFTRLGAAAPVVVYDNSTDYSGMDYITANEHGDEVNLAGSARVVTEFQFEYYAEFVPQGDELARVRFYANTGPAWQGEADYLTPAQPPLWDFTFQVSTGYQTAIISVPSITVPDKFTWTVQFLGLRQELTPTPNEAGLLMYGNATVGASFDDFWERLPDGWAPLVRSDVPKNNFGARILAVTPNSEPHLNIAREANSIRLSWAASATQFHVEARPALGSGDWARVALTPVLNGSRYEVVLPISNENRFFQLSALP